MTYNGIESELHDSELHDNEHHTTKVHHSRVNTGTDSNSDRETQL